MDAHSEQANTASETFESYNVFSPLCQREDRIIADSGATSHMTGKAENFTNYRKETLHRKITIANGNTIEIAGEGIKRFPFISSMEMPTLHVPDLKNTTLFSIGKAVKGGNTFIFNEQGCKLENSKGQTLANGRLRNNLYFMNTRPVRFNNNETVAIASLQKLDMLKLWHYRLGHRNAKDILDMSNLKLANGIDLKGSYHSSPCSDCAVFKAKQRSFPKSREDRPRQVMDVLHSDLCGPLPVPSLTGARYFVTYIDSETKFKFTRLLLHKCDQESTFERLQALCERQTGRKVKILRADNGGEYTSQTFQEYLALQGIQFQSTIAGCSAQNGVAERNHYTLLDMARAMLSHAKLPESFWGATTLYATEITNVLPHPNNRSTTPFECYFGQRPNVKKFKVFGCDAYAMHRKQGNKLSDRSRRMIFIGIAFSQKGWKLYDPTTHKTNTYYHVEFHENRFSGLQQSQSTQAREDSSKNILARHVLIHSNQKHNNRSQDNLTTEENEIHHEDYTQPAVSEESTNEPRENNLPTVSSNAPTLLRRSHRVRSGPKEYWRIPSYEQVEPTGDDSSSEEEDQYQDCAQLSNEHMPLARDIAVPGTANEALNGDFADHWRQSC